MRITNNTKHKHEVHGIEGTLPILPGKSINVREKDISKTELDRIKNILKVEEDRPVEKPVDKQVEVKPKNA